MPSGRRHRPRTPPERIPTLELAISAGVVVVVVGILLVFLFVYHDLPFRIGGP